MKSSEIIAIADMILNRLSEAVANAEMPSELLAATETLKMLGEIYRDNGAEGA